MISNDLSNEQIYSPKRLREEMKGKKHKKHLLEAAQEIVVQAMKEIVAGKKKYTETEDSKIIIELYLKDLKSNEKESEDEYRIRKIFEDTCFPEKEFLDWLDKENWNFEKFISSDTIWYAIVEK